MNPGRRMNKENVETTGRWPAALFLSNQNHWEMMVTISFVTVYVLVGLRGYIYTWWSRMVMTFNFLPVVFLAFTCPSWNWYLLFSWKSQMVDKKTEQEIHCLNFQIEFQITSWYIDSKLYRLLRQTCRLLRLFKFRLSVVSRPVNLSIISVVLSCF